MQTRELVTNNFTSHHSAWKSVKKSHICNATEIAAKGSFSSKTFIQILHVSTYEQYAIYLYASMNFPYKSARMETLIRNSSLEKRQVLPI